jgi:LEA14-like dessication related protein
MKKWILPSLVLLFLATSCTRLKEPDFKGVENLKLGKLGLKKSILRADLHFHNPNGFRLILQRAEGDAWIEDNFLGHFTVDTLVEIPSKEAFRIPVKMEVDMSKLAKNSLLAIFRPEVLIRIEGKAKVGKGMLSINYPFRYSGKHDLGEVF